MFRGEAEMGAIGPFIEVTKEAAPPVRPQDHVTDTEKTASSKGPWKGNWFTNRDNAAGSTDPPATTKARQLQVQAAAEGAERSTGLKGPVSGQGGDDVGIMDHGVPYSLAGPVAEGKGSVLERIRRQLSTIMCCGDLP
jgi:hypothetical protein